LTTIAGQTQEQPGKGLLPLPRHVAIIMDGNGRWARRRGKVRWDGHSAGADAVRSTLESAAEMGIEYLTLYAFSVNNWSRPRLEVEALMHLLTRFARKEQVELIRQNIRVRVVGDLARLPKTPRLAMEQLVQATEHLTGTTLSLALSYGGRQDLVRAAQELARLAKEGKLDPSLIDEKMLQSHMSTTHLPNVDLLIRTGGESRISDFLLFEAAYAELYFSDMMWPEFRGSDLRRAIEDYRGVERRFGLTSEQVDEGELALVTG
jgi:undecaprenyl diphosphate synthase